LIFFFFFFYIFYGSIIITNVSNSSILFPRLLSVHGGSVRVHDYGGRLKRLEGFHALELIEGDLEISEAPNLTGWDAFTSLSRVTGSVTLKTLAIATVGLPSLMDVGIFTARGLPALNSLKGLENLRSVRKLELDSEYESWSFGECGSINVTATPPVRNVCNDSHMTCVDNRCVETLLSTLANAIEVRTFTSLVLHDELYSRQVSMVPGYVFRREHGRHRVSRYSLKSPTIEFIVKNKRRKCSNFYRVCERRQERFNASIIHARHVRVVAHVSHWRRGGNVYRSTLTERP
jgi:hypothetical protein